jgi:hypothetical protein
MCSAFLFNYYIYINNLKQKKMKKMIFSLVVVLLLLSSCNVVPTSDQKLKEKQEQLMNEANSQTGMPAIKNFQERKLMKMILELRDQENLICYCYLANEMNGTVGQFVGKCIGYGLPYATQYTSPEKIASSKETPSHGNITIPQADPNGLYMPASAEGTWVMLIDPTTNEPRPCYFESRVIISPFKLK